MEVPFNMVKYQEEKLMYDIGRFMDLYKKYKDDIDEVLEFAELCKRYYPEKTNARKYNHGYLG